MPSIDLISQSTFIDAWATAGVQLSVADQTVLSFMITAASDGIQRYLGRWMNVRDYIEIRQPIPGQWDKAQPDYVGLSWFPIVPTALNLACTVRTGRSTALLIANQNNQNVQDAWFELYTIGDPQFGLPQPCGMKLSFMSSGVQTDASIPFLGTPTSTGFSVTASGTGGTIPTGTYQCAYSNVNDAGESVPSTAVSVSVTLGQNLVFTLPTLVPYASANNVYVSTTNGAASTMTVQNTSLLAQTSYTLGALVSGAAQQTVNYGTIGQVATAINNLGNGWTTQLQGPTATFSAWPSWDVWASSGAQVGCLATGFTQGLDVFTQRLIAAQLDQSNGCLYLPQGATQWGTGPGNIWQWPGSADIVMGGSSWNGPVLLKYGAGFSVIPYAVQEACCELVKAMFERFGTDTTLNKETADRYSREARQMVKYLPDPVRQALEMYRPRWV
jgi:hypothetical protein